VATTWHISPKFTQAKLDSGKLEDKIDVFEDQITGLLLQHAEALCAARYTERAYAGYAVLAIVSSYFEAIESYHSGESSEGKSKRFFRRGFLRVFPDLPATLQSQGHSSPAQLAEDVADEVYDQLRCGLFHEALVKHRLILRDDTAPLGFMIGKAKGDVCSIVADPPKFVSAIKEHFRVYMAALRNPAETTLRANFEREFDRRRQGDGPVVLPPPVAKS
jgi:hypothetical protein